jgi:hypothetical protein
MIYPDAPGGNGRIFIAEHGSPIPTREGRVKDIGLLRPGVRLRVVAIRPLDGQMTIMAGGVRRTPGRASTRRIMVKMTGIAENRADLP